MLNSVEGLFLSNARARTQGLIEGRQGLYYRHRSSVPRVGDILIAEQCEISDH